MKCPHCLEAFHSSPSMQHLGKTIDTTDTGHFSFVVLHEVCPGCKRSILHLRRSCLDYPLADEVEKRKKVIAEIEALDCGKIFRQGGGQDFLIFPKGYARSPLPPEVPEEFTGDYREAALVLTDSPKASAALSRRCLQHILVGPGGANPKKNLVDQIEEVRPKVPSHFGDMLHDVRAIGNFAAHPMKSTNTGEIIDVEDGEAEWLLDTIEAAFDFYFVQPAKAKQKRDAINAKLTDAGKPPLK